MAGPRRSIVVFDLGGVLIDWDPRHLYRKLFASDETTMEHFLATVCTHEWNRCQDAGRSFAEGARLLKAEHPEKAELIDAYGNRFDEMLAGPIAGAVEILAELWDRGVPLYGLTNWSAETYPEALERFAFLRWFRGILVSGEVGIIKPDPRIFALLIERFGWRAAWLVLGGVVLVLGLAATTVMRRRPEDYGLAPDGAPATRADRSTIDAPVVEVSLGARAATRTPAFWLLVLSTNLAGLGFFGVNLHLFSYITDRGISAAVAATLVTYLYTLHTVAKPLWGLIAERVHVRHCIAACYAGGALGVLLLLGGSMPWLVAFATVYGLTRGAQSFVTSLAWADYFGREAQGAIRGLASPFRHLSAAAGPIVGGVLYDITGDYRLAFAIFAAAFVAGGGVALLAKPPR